MKTINFCLFDGNRIYDFIPLSLYPPDDLILGADDIIIYSDIIYLYIDLPLIKSSQLVKFDSPNGKYFVKKNLIRLIINYYTKFYRERALKDNPNMKEIYKNTILKKIVNVKEKLYICDWEIRVEI